MTTKKEDTKDAENTGKERPTCFVIMPIADMIGYDPGHFTRVYEYLIKPAVTAAGYKPIRADDTSKTDYIVVGIIQKIIESEMILCDLSGRNANVLYELGIRHAFNKPVTLIKDEKTDKIFDIQGLRYTEYAASLRVDKTQSEIAKIKQSIIETGHTKNKDLNSIVKMAGVHAAETPDKTTISGEANIILSALKQIDNRITKIEQNKDTKTTSFETDNLPNKEVVSWGEQLFIEGNPIGIYTGQLEDGSIVVRDEESNMLIIKKSSPNYFKLSTLPF